MPSVVIRSGHKVYKGEKGDGGYALLRILSTIMDPHREDLMGIISEHVDFSENEELYKEVRQVDGLGQRIFEEAEQYYEMAAVEL